MYVTFVILHSKRMCCIILSSVTCLALPYFSTHKARFYGGGGEMNIKRVFLYNFSPKHFILRFQPDTVINVHNLHAKTPFLCQILTKLEFWKILISNFMKIQPRRTYRHKQSLFAILQTHLIKHTLQKETRNVA